MMAGSILVLLSQPASIDACLGAAAAVSSCFQRAPILALFVRHAPEETLVTGEEVLTAARRAALEAAESQRLAALKQRFEIWQRGNPSGRWVEGSGKIADALVAWAPEASLVVLAQAPEPRQLEEREAIDAAIFELRRPVLIVPGGWHGDSLGVRVAIGWKENEPARRAVLAARPLLAGATTVTAFAVGHEGDNDESGFVTALASTGIAVPVLQHVDRLGLSTGAALLREAGSCGADLLVCGAYSHRQMAERVFGGVTRDVLRHAEIPVLMAH
jgi:nucleotide-binding universal stress UspA family protein